MNILKPSITLSESTAIATICLLMNLKNYTKGLILCQLLRVCKFICSFSWPRTSSSKYLKSNLWFFRSYFLKNKSSNLLRLFPCLLHGRNLFRNPYSPSFLTYTISVYFSFLFLSPYFGTRISRLHLCEATLITCDGSQNQSTNFASTLGLWLGRSFFNCC